MSLFEVETEKCVLSNCQGWSRNTAYDFEHVDEGFADGKYTHFDVSKGWPKMSVSVKLYGYIIKRLGNSG